MTVRCRQTALVTVALLLAALTGIALLPAPAWGEAPSGLLRFPLTNDACPTSSFGSWRSGHLHAGLDFSTGGVTGVPVLAVDSCRVWRIRIWNGGYGKALYAELADGKTALYGHLSRFIPEIESLVEAEQDLKGAYEVEILFGGDGPVFGPGDTLAFSGETGSGPPHLHFELRSGRGDHDKINPVPDYMDLREAARPVIKSVRLIPLGPDSRIDGRYGPVAVVPGPDTEVLVAGAFGLSVYATDPVQCGRVLKPIHYMASVDGVPVFQLSLDRFPFSKGHYVGGFYESAGGSKYVRLFDAFDLDFGGFNCRTAEGPAPGGLLTPGRHDLLISVADAWGNTREARVPFVLGTVPVFKIFRLSEDSSGARVEVEAEPPGVVAEIAYRSGGGWQALAIESEKGGGGAADLRIDAAAMAAPLEVRCRLAGESGLAVEGALALGKAGGGADTSLALRTRVHRRFVEIIAAPGSPPSGLPRATVHEGSSSISLLLQPAGENTFRGTFVPATESGTVLVAVRAEFGGHVVEKATEIAIGHLRPAREVWLSTENYRVRLTVPETYSSESLITVSEEPGPVHSGFVRSAGRLTMEPVDVFLNDRVGVLVVRRDHSLKGGWGVFAEAGEWVSFRGGFNERGWCEYRMRQPEHLVMLEDIEGPEIEAVRALERRQTDGKATFTSRVSDAGSGLDAGSLAGYVDGQPAVVSIDPDTGIVRGRTTKPLPYGEHRIRLEAQDRLGNASVGEFTLSLSR